jgi:hypothetical protein
MNALIEREECLLKHGIQIVGTMARLLHMVELAIFMRLI